MADPPDTIPLSLPITIGRDICRNLDRSMRLEWLDTNHTGAFAMGTVAGVNTRRYHGLLVASLKPPADRYAILSRLEELVNLDGVEFALAANQYPGAIYPRGFELLDEFRIDPFPEWRYRLGSATLIKTVCVLDQQQTVLVNYRSDRACTLRVRLLTAFRDYHAVGHQNNQLADRLQISSGRVSFQPYDQLPPLTVIYSGAFQKDGEWFLRHQYLRELERGLDFEEDLFSPGFIDYQLGPGQDSWLLATLGPPQSQAADIPAILSRERTSRLFQNSSPLQASLQRALDQFRIVRYDGTPSLIAGYPWFTDWSRDTLISLPALSQAGFPPSETREILRMLISERSEGLLPNRFLDSGSQPEYNTADATLWLFVAAKDYIDRTQDLTFLKDFLYPAAQDIVSWHQRGTKYGIHVDPGDLLLWAGETNTQLTWMDARVNGLAITPRVGKPVEINALWYNALCIFAAWSRALGFDDEGLRLDREAADMLASFRKAFWNPRRQCLFDVVTQEAQDETLRPNQLFALSLPYPLISPDLARLIVNLVREKLLTPVGLRTLEPGHHAYQPRFEGNMAQRDAAYHQGTVWPWLMGPFVSAYLYAYENSADATEFCRDALQHLQQELTTCCLGSLAEVYDGEAPHLPGGCPAQLWSIAQLLISMQRLRAVRP